MARVRNTERVEVIAAYLMLNADAGRGKSVSEIAEATEISIPSVKRILTEAGFVRALAPRYPFSYFYSPAAAINTTRPLIKTKPQPNETNEAFMTRLGEVSPVKYHALDPAGVGVLPETIIDVIIPALREGAAAIKALSALSDSFVNNNPYDEPAARVKFANLDKARRAAHIANDLMSRLLNDPRLLEPDYWLVFVTTEVNP